MFKALLVTSVAFSALIYTLSGSWTYTGIMFLTFVCIDIIVYKDWV